MNSGPGSSDIDSAKLSAWFSDHVDGFEGPLEVARLGGGQSNPTFEAATPNRAYILRSKPLGPLLPTAHAVEREFRVLKALGPTGFPVPRAYALCEDSEVTGAAFYVMDRVDGRILRDSTLPGCAPEERRAIWTAMVETLAALHRLDPDALGLSDFGKREGYLTRQIGRWTKQYRASETDQIDDMEALIDDLARSTPPEDSVRLIHGDFKIDNVMLEPARPAVAAVLDWELSTLGDPLADLSYLLMNWAAGPLGAASRDPASGVPPEAELLDLYCARTGRDRRPDLRWRHAFNQFRLACILQGIVGRARAGTAAAADAASLGERVPILAASALSLLHSEPVVA